MLSKVLSAAIQGVNGYIVYVEVDLCQGIPAFDIVGLPNSAVKESKDRVSTVIRNYSKEFLSKRITVNLAPANTKKEGADFDLPIAAAILVCLSVIEQKSIENTLIIGELSLDGFVRPVNGILPMIYTAKNKGITNCIVPFENREEAAIVKGVNIYGIKHLEQLISHFKGNTIEKTEVDISTFFSLEDFKLDFKDVRGQKSTKRALEIAAAGNHNLLMVGSPGSGKTMLAKRLPTILPNLTFEESMEVTSIYSISGLLENKLITKRPFRSPHHTTSYAALTGGGRIPKPGEISLSHNGVLFLDELTEFHRNVLEVLRQPIEEGKITISRANGNLEYPSRFMLIASMNPCPCGYYGDFSKCTCSQNAVSKYLSKISGPLLDRIDIQIETLPVTYSELGSNEPDGESSEQIRERVVACRNLQAMRYKEEGICVNSELSASQIQKFCHLESEEDELLKQAFGNLGLSGRAYHKILKVARTIADLECSARINQRHLAEAISYRSLDRKYWGN